MLGMWREPLDKDCPHRKENPRGLYNLEATITVEDMARETP